MLRTTCWPSACAAPGSRRRWCASSVTARNLWLASLAKISESGAAVPPAQRAPSSACRARPHSMNRAVAAQGLAVRPRPARPGDVRGGSGDRASACPRLRERRKGARPATGRRERRSWCDAFRRRFVPPAPSLAPRPSTCCQVGVTTAQKHVTGRGGTSAYPLRPLSPAPPAVRAGSRRTRRRAAAFRARRDRASGRWCCGATAR